jgi:hypothetical protein
MNLAEVLVGIDQDNWARTKTTLTSLPSSMLGLGKDSIDR